MSARPGRHMRLLIATFPDDVHALEVALVLRERGHEVVIWSGGDFPTLQSASVDYEGAGARWSASGPELELSGGGIDVVWYRRAVAPALPKGMHPGDRPVAQRECEDFVAGLWRLVAPGAFWVNPLEGRTRADLKLVQLREAQRAGLAIPRTLASNDPRRIRAFLEELGGPAIYKGFNPQHWRDGDDVAVLFTSEVSPAKLPPDEVLRLTPGIFQPRLAKAHELRVTVMGERMVTARLASQTQAATRLDWRTRSVGLGIEPDALPAPVEAGVRALMRELGLVFGCLDFVVTPEGEHVFLEVNPMGQFLWVEDVNPEIRLLGPFCDFLLARGRPDGRLECAAVRHADYAEHADALRSVAAEHVRWEDPYVTDDASTPRSGRPGAGAKPEGRHP